MRLKWFVWGACWGLHALVWADGHVGMPAKVLPAYVQECAACHQAYPPALLPGPSWNRIMTGLSQHYGVDAALSSVQVQEIGQWLQSHAGQGRKIRAAPPQDRITRADWFLREHRKVAAAVWQLPEVRSPSQCVACHTHAEQGRFEERELRSPAGLRLR